MKEAQRPRQRQQASSREAAGLDGHSCAGCQVATPEVDLFMTSEGGMCAACYGEHTFEEPSTTSLFVPVLRSVGPWAGAGYLAYMHSTSTDSYYSMGNDMAALVVIATVVLLIGTIAALQNAREFFRERRNESPDRVRLASAALGLMLTVTGILAFLGLLFT